MLHALAPAFIFAETWVIFVLRGLVAARRHILTFSGLQLLRGPAFRYYCVDTIVVIDRVDPVDCKSASRGWWICAGEDVKV